MHTGIPLLGLPVCHPAYFTFLALKALTLLYALSLKMSQGRPRRRRISPTYRIEFPWSRSRRLTSQAAVEFFPRRRRRI